MGDRTLATRVPGRAVLSLASWNFQYCCRKAKLTYLFGGDVVGAAQVIAARLLHLTSAVWVFDLDNVGI